MSRKGNCWDNAVAESFFKSLKVEWYTKIITMSIRMLKYPFLSGSRLGTIGIEDTQL